MCCFKMKILAITPAHETGASFYSAKLYSRLPAEIVSGQCVFPRLLRKLLRAQTDVYHLQYEYQGFGNFLKSLAVLVGLTIVLHLRKPVIVTLHGLLVSDSVPRRFGWLLYFAYVASVKTSALFASAFIVHSELMQEIMKRVYHIERVVVIPHGTDNDESDSQRNLDSNNLVFYGFIRPSKGIENLIDAVGLVKKTMPHISLTIAGTIARPSESSYVETIERHVRESMLEHQVTFKRGFIDTAERKRLMTYACGVLLPYTDNFIEVSGVVHDIAEYGVPIICSDAPRFSELINEFDCIKTDPKPEKLAAAILRVLVNKEFRANLGTNLRLRVISESWDRTAERHLLLYQQCISSSFFNAPRATLKN